jgi:hypothetical protein
MTMNSDSMGTGPLKEVVVLQSFHGPCNRFRKSRFFGAKLGFKIKTEYVGGIYMLVDLGHAKKSRVSHQF